MTQIPLLSGVLASERADFVQSFPINLEPVAMESGISKGYLRSTAGIRSLGTGPGIDRGGILWNGKHLRVMGTSLVSVGPSGAVTTLGDVGSSGPVALYYGFDRLAIQSGTSLYYWNGIDLTQVTDPDLGPCIDIAWFKGQYFSTDGASIVATQLADPTQVDPNKYGSAEADPDMVTGLLPIRNELAVTGQNTIEFFSYTGGSGFPLSPNEGATIPIGCVGPRAKCLFAQTFAFVGGGRNEANGVWLAQSGTAAKLSTRAIDDLIALELNPSAILMESRVSRDEQRLLIHLSDKTLIYFQTASVAAGKAVWEIARSGRAMNRASRARNMVLVDGKAIVGDVDSSALGILDEGTGEQFGEATGWQFDTQLIYNGGKGAILHSLELVGLPGRGVTGPVTVFWSYTLDGETWSQERPTTLVRGRRCQWRPHKRFGNYMGLRFRGDSASLAGWASLEAELEALRT